MNNVFYFKNIGSVGGCESFFYYLSKCYKDLVIYYRVGNPEQIKRLAENVEVRQYKENEIIECNNFFCCYYPDIIDNVKAKHYYHIIHCDYKNVWFDPIINPKFEKYIAVSKVAGESFKEITGLDYELIYNPISIDKPEVEKYNDGKLHLISATRLTREKGLKRMQILARYLEKSGIDYEWIVYTNRKREPIGNYVIYKDSKLDILEDIARADALVQLSDCEAFCYSIVEAEMVGTKVIATDLPVLKELGIKHNINASICDFNMSNIDLSYILDKSTKIDFNPPTSYWDKYLKKESNYDPEDIIDVKALKKYFDLEIGQVERNKYYKMTKVRVSELESKGLVERCD